MTIKKVKKSLKTISVQPLSEEKTHTLKGGGGPGTIRDDILMYTIKDDLIMG